MTALQLVSIAVTLNSIVAVILFRKINHLNAIVNVFVARHLELDTKINNLQDKEKSKNVK